VSPVVPRRGVGYTPSTITPTLNPAGAFTPPTPVDIGPAAQEIRRQVEEHQQKADETAFIGADAQLTQLSNSLLYDPKTGALSRRGLDAQAIHDPTIEAWQKGVSQIEMGLQPHQRESFKNRVDARAGEFDRVIMEHVRREMNTATADAASANLDAERTAVLHNYADPLRISAGIAHQKAILTVAGDNLGWSPELTQQKIAEAVSQIHSDVLSRMIASGNDLSASKYFQAHVNELEPAALIELQKHVDMSSLRGESQRRTDSIVQSTATLGGALTEARKIEDPELRDATEQRISRYYELKAADDRQQREEAFDRAGQLLEQTHDIDKIPPGIFLRLSVEERLQLKRRENELLFPKRVTNPDLYTSLINMSSLAGSQVAFRDLDLKQYRNALSESDYQRVLRRQIMLRDQTIRAANSPAARARAQLDSLMRPPTANPQPVPGSPIRPSPPAQSGDINLGVFNTPASGAQHLSPADLEKARRDPRYREYLRAHGVQVP
jgi:hypothetical protein